jgi:hypothetical protein
MIRLTRIMSGTPVSDLYNAPVESAHFNSSLSLALASPFGLQLFSPNRRLPATAERPQTVGSSLIPPKARPLLSIKSVASFSKEALRVSATSFPQKGLVLADR